MREDSSVTEVNMYGLGFWVTISGTGTISGATRDPHTLLPFA